MTIDSGWTKIIKTNVPVAFSSTLEAGTWQNKPETVFIDGQIKMMKAEAIKTWALFVKVQFINTIHAAFQTGATVVVLGFDNYAHVPTCKAMTQRKRSRAVPNMEFLAGQELPPLPPDDWNSAMRNRSFKAKVMQLISRNVHHSFQDLKDKTVIIDFKDEPEMVGMPITLPPVMQMPQIETARRGECDIKAFSWSKAGETLLIESTDGDFIPIALVHVEDAERQGKPVSVILHRMKTNVTPAKRKRDGGFKREYEYIGMQPILEWVRRQFPKAVSPARAFASLVATTGCDFCMNLPQIGPSTLWKNVALVKNIDTTTAVGMMTALLTLYLKQFKASAPSTQDIKASTANVLPTTKTPLSHTAYAQLFEQVQESHRVGQRIKDNMFHAKRMLAHVKNTMWTLQYWTDLHEFQDPLEGDFGFVRHKQIVIFDGTNE